MDDLEQQLKNALSRKDTPDWFEAKVLAAVRREPARSPRRPALLWRWVSALALVVLITSVAWQRERAIRERTQGEAAKAQLQLALRITSIKLHKIEQKLNEVERND